MNYLAAMEREREKVSCSKDLRKDNVVCCCMHELFTNPMCICLLVCIHFSYIYATSKFGKRLSNTSWPESMDY